MQTRPIIPKNCEGGYKLATRRGDSTIHLEELATLIPNYMAIHECAELGALRYLKRKLKEAGFKATATWKRRALLHLELATVTKMQGEVDSHYLFDMLDQIFADSVLVEHKPILSRFANWLLRTSME